MLRNRWSAWIGTGGRHAPESAIITGKDQTTAPKYRLDSRCIPRSRYFLLYRPKTLNGLAKGPEYQCLKIPHHRWLMREMDTICCVFWILVTAEIGLHSLWNLATISL